MVADRRAVFLIGAGVSIQTTGGVPAASWPGFVAAGLRLAAERTADRLDTEGWVGWVATEMNSADPERRLAAEDLVFDRLGGLASTGVAQ
jgi:hypothetical protein